MSEIWHGETLVLVARRRLKSVSGGYQTTEVYEGTHEAILEAEGKLATALADYEAEYGNGTPVARLTVTTPDTGDQQPPDNGILSTTFEVAGNMDHRSLYEHWRFLSLDDTIKTKFKTALKNAGDTKDIVAAINGQQLTGVAADFCKRIWYSQDSFLEPQFVFRIQQIIHRAKVELPIAFGGVRQIYTSAQLKAETNPTALYIAAIDQAYNSTLASYGASVPAGHRLGWMKQTPTVSPISRTRSAASCEFWLEAWPLLIYDAKP